MPIIGLLSMQLPPLPSTTSVLALLNISFGYIIFWTFVSFQRLTRPTMVQQASKNHKILLSTIKKNIADYSQVWGQRNQSNKLGSKLKMVDFKLNCKKIPDENQIEFNADNRESLVSHHFYVKLIT